MQFLLEVQLIAPNCLFKLSWGRGRQVTAMVAYPTSLWEKYQAWQSIYLQFYQTALRARVKKPKQVQGLVTLPQNRERILIEAETELLKTFQQWLRRQELFEIRETIAQQASTQNYLYLSCSRELERLPWEAVPEFNQGVAMLRQPQNIKHLNHKTKRLRGKPRILAILGDDTGLDLQGDRLLLNNLQRLAHIKLLVCRHDLPGTELKSQIKQTLIEPRGWDMLFFAGHSSETNLTGGELALNSSTTITMQEIATELQVAHSNGLQFALFNSCCGLSIAKFLTDLGLGQVAVMRESIHNQVAQLFLSRFLQALSQHLNVQQALTQAAQDLQQEVKYPSAYLIPSLFCHPDAELYALPPRSWLQSLGRWKPTPQEAIATGVLCLLSMFPPVENFLLNQRTLIQAVYRDLTGQLPTESPPITLVHIDATSLTKAAINTPVPLNRTYLAQLIDHLVAADANIVGIDYLLDRPQIPHDPILAQSVQDAVEQEQTWFIFGAYQQVDGQEVGVAPETNIGNAHWTLQGYTDGLPGYLSSLDHSDNCTQACPFAYLLASVKTAGENFAAPRLDSKQNLRHQVVTHLAHDPSTVNSSQLPLLTTLSQYLGQQWLRPIQDYSLPPDTVYQRLPAWQLLADAEYNFASQIVLIGAGGYQEAGLTPGSDNFSSPLAISYWDSRKDLNRGEIPFTGSEMLAYMTHHWLEHHLITPIPALWLLLMILLGVKGWKLFKTQQLNPKLVLLLLPCLVAIYGLVALQLFIFQNVLLPWLLPSIALNTYWLDQKRP